MATMILVNIGSVIGLLSDGIKPLPEPMFTYDQWHPMVITWGLFHNLNLPGANELIII